MHPAPPVANGLLTHSDSDSSLTVASEAASDDVADLIELAWQSREKHWDRSQRAVRRLWRRDDLSPLERARLQVLNSDHHGRRLELRAAVASGIAALPVIDAANDLLWMCRAHGRIAAGVHSLGDFATAARHYQVQIRIASDQLDHPGLTAADKKRFTEELFCGRHNMAHQCFRRGELQQAHQYYQSCYELVNEGEVHSGYLLVNHAQCYLQQGYYRKAETQASAALQIGRDHNASRIVVYALPVLAALASRNQRGERAERYLQEAIATAGQAGLYKSLVQLKLAEHYLERDDTERAASVLATMDEVTDAIDEAQYYLAQCHLAEKRNDYATALLHHKKHLAVKERIFSTQQENQSYAMEVAARLQALESSNQSLNQRNLELSRNVEEIGRDHSRLQWLAQRDPLTELYNRRHFMEIAEAQLQRLRGGDTVLSLAIVDIDLFKHTNDNHGHDVGDTVLKHLAALLERGIRSSDSLARFGGEEFVVLLPGTGLLQAERIMQRLRIRCEQYAWPALSAGLAVTCSIGVAQADAETRFAGLFKRADLALYRAKRGGRNRVECARPDADQASVERPPKQIDVGCR